MTNHHLHHSTTTASLRLLLLAHLRLRSSGEHSSVLLRTRHMSSAWD